MLDKVIKGIISIIGVIIGLVLAIVIYQLGILNFIDERYHIYLFILLGLIFGIIFFILTPKFKKLGMNIAGGFETELLKVPTTDIILGSIGLIVGLIIAFLLSQPFYNLNISYVGTGVSILLYLLFGYLGVRIATTKKEDMAWSIFNKKNSGSLTKQLRNKQKSCPKILDTSVIIDGRIADICRTGFIEGQIVIPEFVLEELRHIADSSDGLKRNRGRRGLDILNRLQKEEYVDVTIEKKDFKDVSEVDTKLLKLAEVLDGKVLTNDYNLNKVAEFQGVEVLNINELANAVKPVVLPGEEMTVQVIRDGKESGQGLAYLDDGTMIVVEGGRKYIGETITVIVTSVLQTAAGRMIFAKLKSAANKAG